MIQVLLELVSTDFDDQILAHHVATNIPLNERCILVSKRLDQVKNVVLVV